MSKRPRAAVESAKMSGKWERSTFGAGDLDALVADGMVVAGDARLPGDESIPEPAADERVCFQAFFHRGFALCNSPVFTKIKIFVFGVNCLIVCFVCGVCIPDLSIGDYFPPSYLVSDGDQPLPP